VQGLAGARERPAARRRSQRQRWELAAAALEHLGACLALLGAPAPGGADGREPPGTAVMLDLLREREGARGAWAALGGVDALLAERRDAPWGAAKEAAALAALRLLRLALERDGAAVAALRRAPQAGAARRAALIQTLTFTLRRRRSDRRRRSMRSRV